MKIDNIFKRTISDKNFAEKFEVQHGKYNNIAEGINSRDCNVRMLASVLKTLDKEVEMKKSEMKLRNQDTSVVFSDTDKASLYRKIIKQLQTEFLTK